MHRIEKFRISVRNRHEAMLELVFDKSLTSMTQTVVATTNTAEETSRSIDDAFELYEKYVTL